jgi:hypothetical protein
MGAAAALDFTYLYRFSSAVGDFGRGFGLRLATCGAHHENPYFFDARLRQPRTVGDMLLVLSEVVRTHFFLPRPPNLDPVVTSNEDMLRFEGFSGCCGVYARADLPAEAFESDLQGRGTTNVDFNNPMRAALTRLRDCDDARLAVGTDEVALSQGDAHAVEKKVKLPVRWIKGFSEVQAYQPLLTLKHELPVTEARRFMRSLPRGGAPKRPSFVTALGKALRLSQRETPGAIRITGLNRLRVIEPLLGAAKKLRIWSDDSSGVSAWEAVFDAGGFFVLISPELYRGFSGEGQVLQQLATGDWEDALTSVRAQLTWQSQIDAGRIARQAELPEDAVRSALAVLGSRGLAGYDASRGCYFHRELPFELDKVEALQPRLRGARKLLADEKVKLLKQLGDEAADVEVAGTGVMHQVRLRGDGDKCTCPWFSKNQGQRGPCKHILAARMFIDPESAEPIA